MRKDSNRQKNEGCKQLKLFSIHGESAVIQTSGTGNGNDAEAGLFSRLEQQRALTETILERIV